ncbi:MAG: GNAT family N-acetyltransferase [Mesorhizobium sp.]|uniref:GNAT family N-acetyltransferase n=1 Tax=unclassified Mesorhizobium TaxID=325217 RepID=UPI000FCB0E34|nr:MULTISPECIES: GNAT family N-acetyltransferase [unclassified Mesorhizobium]RUV53834.1 N-acetyltransferase [Mesorhizobium sp. M5C.F.Ca.IN.020.29.1.1]TIM81950.1 MAG: GNAT family N-acetyltransferase [Mesorhizobium sp.]TIR28180.1 MAG: GNAT family N-acetyltransferase [Mesorhizobium sp.]TIS21613.1 MAG: GNAT family N-acetyltransferase [Mesorhizobium sp.]
MARPSDLVALAGGRPLTRQHGRAFSLQLDGEAWTMTLDGAPIGAAGFWPADGFREAWLMLSPAFRKKSVLPAALRMVADHLQTHFDPVLPTVAAVDLDNRGGRAIATRLGFIDVGDHPQYPGAAMFVLVRT